MDTLIEIFNHLSIECICKVCPLVCKLWNQVCRSNSLWIVLFKREFPSTCFKLATDIKGLCNIKYKWLSQLKGFDILHQETHERVVMKGERGLGIGIGHDVGDVRAPLISVLAVGNALTRPGSKNLIMVPARRDLYHRAWRGLAPFFNRPLSLEYKNGISNWNLPFGEPIHSSLPTRFSYDNGSTIVISSDGLPDKIGDFDLIVIELCYVELGVSFHAFIPFHENVVMVSLVGNNKKGLFFEKLAEK